MMMKVLVTQVKHLLFVIKSNFNRRMFFFISFLNSRKANIEKSTEYLTKYLQKVSTKEGENQYAKAYSALGLIETTLVYFKSFLLSLSHNLSF